MNKRFEWHHSVRTRFGETLCYYFLSFSPPFDRKKTIEAMNALFAAEQIIAHTRFEVFGRMDLVVRAWLPGTKVMDFLSTMTEFLVSRGCAIAESEEFHVARNPYHWAWPVEKGVGGGAEGLRLDSLTVAELNAVHHGQNLDLYTQLLEADLLRELPMPTNGLRFFVTIPQSTRHTNNQVEDQLVKDVVEILHRQHTKTVGLKEAVLYRGLGKRIVLLVDAVVPLEDYRAIVQFNDEIIERSLRWFDVKTTTYLPTLPDGGTAESAAVSSAASMLSGSESRDALYYLNAVEGQELEHKGSLELNLKTYFETGREERSPELATSILKTIVAFLNSSGGELLIGAVEEGKFKGTSSERMGDFPQVGNLLVSGINREYQFCRDKNWDGFHRKLVDLYSGRIGKAYFDCIRVRRLDFQEKDLCLIQVLPLPRGKFAYLDRDAFFVRVEGSTRELDGPDQDEYKARRRRWDIELPASRS